MGKNGEIEHEGIVKKMTKDTAIVEFSSPDSCGACNVKGACSVEGKTGEELTVNNVVEGEFNEGEKVKIIMKESLGLKAVFIAYILPFLILLTALFVFDSLLNSEAVAGLIALGLLVPYYVVIYLARNKIKKEINFTLEKI